MDKNEIAIVTEKDIRDKIYIIRGQRVMLETDLAEIYGYDHKGFNKQVSNNEDRFDEDFRFLLTWDEVSDYLVDNYVGIKTLALLKNAAPRVRIIVFTDNPRRTLHLTEYQDFCREYPNMRISFQRTIENR